MRLLKKLRESLDPRPRFHFLHIGKTGGNSIKGALKEQLKESRFSIRLHSHRITLRKIPAGQAVFFVLREPISRFISGFNSRLRMGQPRNYVPWSPEEKTAFERFKTPDELAQALLSSNPEERAAAENAMRSIEHVRDKYAKWFESEEYFLSRLKDVVHIGFQESLDQDFEVLKARLQLPVSLQLPQGDIATHKSPANMNKKLQPSSIEVLQKWYADDIRFYDLCRKLVAENKVGKKL